MSAPRRPYDVLKRALDVVFSALLLVLLLPFLVLVALAVLVTMGGPVLFRQERPGRFGSIFTVLKFRTMRPPPEGASDLDAAASDGNRLTRLGRFLRATSLDELPQLWNILIGNMSFVGPRPLLVEYLPLYSPTQARRHEVRPGLTGLAQASGRNTLDWDQQFELDVLYVDTRSLAVDARILARSVGVVLRREGVDHTESPARVPFAGSRGGSPGDRTDESGGV